MGWIGKTIAVLSVVSACAITAVPTFAATPHIRAGIALTNNVISMYERTPGRITRTVTFINENPTPATYYVNRTGVTYSAANIPEFDPANPSRYDWVNVSPSVLHMAPDSQERVTITADPSPAMRRGTFYAALVFAPKLALREGKATIGVGLSAQVALQVGPVVPTRVTLLNRPVPWILWGQSPTSIQVQLRNAGTSFVAPTAFLTVSEGGHEISSSKAVLGYVVPKATGDINMSVAALPPGIAQAVFTITAPGLKHPIVWKGWIVRVPLGTVLFVLFVVAAVEVMSYLRSRGRNGSNSKVLGEMDL